MRKDFKTIQSISMIVRENPRAAAAIVACLFFSSLIEGIGISAVFPLISIILETDTQLPNSKISEFIYYLEEFGAYFLAGFVVAAFVIKSLLLTFTISIIAKNVAGFSHKLRVSYIEALLNANIHFVQSKSVGESLSVLSNDSIRSAAAYISAARILSNFFQVLLYFSYAVWLSLEATLLSIITVVTLFFLIKGTMSRTRIAGAHTTQFIHDISKSMGQALQGIKQAKATASENYLKSHIVSGSKELQRAHRTNIVVSQHLRNIQDPVTVTSALICLFLFKDIVKLEPGYIIFLLAVYYRLMNAFNLLLVDYQKYIGQETALWSIQDNIKEADQKKERAVTHGNLLPSEPQTIYFHNVSASFGRKVIFSDLSFKIPVKKFTIFKGESGRGKTTCIDMICCLKQPDAGEIIIGSEVLENLPTQPWREKIGYVDQFPFLFQASIRDNILLDAQDISDQEIEETIRLCHLDTFIQHLDMGIDTILHEGGKNISGGQRQRIAIARSVIRKPHYLILDEPTSALDEQSATIILQTLKDLSKKMTVIAISHSNKAIEHADNVIDFDNLY